MLDSQNATSINPATGKWRVLVSYHILFGFRLYFFPEDHLDKQKFAEAEIRR